MAVWCYNDFTQYNSICWKTQWSLFIWLKGNFLIASLFLLPLCEIMLVLKINNLIYNAWLRYIQGFKPVHLLRWGTADWPQQNPIIKRFITGVQAPNHNIILGIRGMELWLELMSFPWVWSHLLEQDRIIILLSPSTVGSWSFT